MHPAGQIPDEPRINRAEGQLSSFGTCPQTVVFAQHPHELDGRKIRVDGQARDGADFIGVFNEFFGDVGAAAVLPDNRGTNGDTRLPVPHDRGFALIGDAERADIVFCQTRTAQSCADHLAGGEPDFLGVVFNPAGLREALCEFGGRRSDRAAIFSEDDRTGARRPLIEGEQVHDQSLPGSEGA